MQSRRFALRNACRRPLLHVTWSRFGRRGFIGLASLLTLMAVGSATAAIQSGPQDVVVMIHGAGGGGWEYDRWRPVFTRAGWRVIARDLQPVRAGLAATTFDDYAAQVGQWIPRRHRRLVLVGASMGGLLALKVAERAKPDAIILVNSVPPAGVGKPRGQAKPYPPVVRWANGPIQDTRDSLPDGDEATIRWATKLWRDESGAVLNSVRRDVSVSKPTVPILVILGAKDTDVPFASGLALAQWVGADVQLYTATSHIGPLYGRRAREIAEAARVWLTSRLSSTHIPSLQPQNPPK